jgi:hypothetical protein
LLRGQLRYMKQISISRGIGEVVDRHLGQDKAREVQKLYTVRSKLVRSGRIVCRSARGVPPRRIFGRDVGPSAAGVVARRLLHGGDSVSGCWPAPTWWRSTCSDATRRSKPTLANKGPRHADWRNQVGAAVSTRDCLPLWTAHDGCAWNNCNRPLLWAQPLPWPTLTRRTHNRKVGCARLLIGGDLPQLSA